MNTAHHDTADHLHPVTVYCHKSLGSAAAALVVASILFAAMPAFSQLGRGQSWELFSTLRGRSSPERLSKSKTWEPVMQ